VKIYKLIFIECFAGITVLSALFFFTIIKMSSWETIVLYCSDIAQINFFKKTVSAR
jgi:hypothetical protein